MTTATASPPSTLAAPNLGRPRRQSSYNSLLSSVPENSDSISLTPSASSSTIADSYLGVGTGGEAKMYGEWVLDVEGMQGQRERWSERERVILVLGDYSANTLQPLLTDPVFSNTLLILGTMRSKQPLIPISRTGISVKQLPPPQWAHCTIQDLVERALPVAKAWRKRNHRSRPLSTSIAASFSFLTSSSNNRPKSKAATPQVIDSVINFLSPALRFDPRQAMPKLLREVVMCSTAILASVSQAQSQTQAQIRDGKASAGRGTMLLHILPASYPAALPGCVEEYLLSLFPSHSSSSSSSPAIRPIVMPQQTFLAERIAGSYDGVSVSAAEAVLLDNLAWAPADNNAYGHGYADLYGNGGADKQNQKHHRKQSLYIPSWSTVSFSIGGQRLGNGVQQSVDSTSVRRGSAGSLPNMRRGSGASMDSRASSMWTGDGDTSAEHGPATPLGSSDSLDIAASGSPAQVSASALGAAPPSLSKLRVTNGSAPDLSPPNAPYAQLQHLPVQRSRLSYVETFDPDESGSAPSTPTTATPGKRWDDGQTDMGTEGTIRGKASGVGGREFGGQNPKQGHGREGRPSSMFEQGFAPPQSRRDEDGDSVMSKRKSRTFGFLRRK